MNVRPIEPEDLDFVYQVENNIKLQRYSLSNEPFSRYLLTQYLTNLTGDIYTDRQLHLVIEDDDGRAIGLVDLTDFEPRHKRVQIGIVILPEARRRGYALSAIKWVENYVKTNTDIKQLYAIISEKNKASQSLFKKAGFASEVVLKQWLYGTEGCENAVLMQSFL